MNTAASEQSSLKKIQDQLKSELREYSVKWDNPEKFHLTLRFLGDLDEDNIDSLVFTLERLKTDFEEIIFTSNGIGFFPNQKYPNVVFTDLTETGENSNKLVGFIDNIILNFGIKPEKRFVPHITLGRFRRDNRKKLEKTIDIQFEPFNLNFSSFFLMKSVLKPQGSEYEIIKEFSFDQ